MGLVDRIRTKIRKGVNRVSERAGLFKKDVHACTQSRDGAGHMLTVVGTNADGIELKALVRKHFGVILIMVLCVGKSVRFNEKLYLSRLKVAYCNNLYSGCS